MIAENQEINVTRFVDVVLVPLIIFMVAASLATVMSRSTSRSLPSRSRGPDKPIFLSIKADHTPALGDAAIAEDGLAAALHTASAAARSSRCSCTPTSRSITAS